MPGLPAHRVCLHRCSIAIVGLIVGGWPLFVRADEKLSSRSQLLRQQCADCHTGDSPSGAFDLDKLGESLDDPKTLSTWTRILDRVSAGEMPPKDADALPEAEKQRFTESTHDWLQTFQESQFRLLGRVRGRRLTNLQLERTLHDLFGIDIPLASEMPVEPKTSEFSTFFEGQTMSHFHLEQHLKIVDLALDELFRRASISSDDAWKQEMSAKQIARTNKRCREPEYIDHQAVVWSGRLEFYGRMPATEVQTAGWYRIRFQVRSLKQPDDHGVWCSVRVGEGVSSAPLLAWAGSFEAEREPKVVTMDVWMPYSHLLEIRPNDRTLKQARFQGGQAADGEGGDQDVPGIGIDWLSMERIHQGMSSDEIRRRVFTNLRFKKIELKDRFGKETTMLKMVSEKPRNDIARLITNFSQAAFRRALTKEDVEPYINFSLQNFDETNDIAAALRAGFRSLLCSPRFLYFQEKPGELDDFAIASRLSYLLWNSMPDEELFQVASDGKLGQDGVVDAQVERMLQDPRGRNFIPDLAAQWLELDQIDFTEPDAKLYPNFDLVVQRSMLDETHRFLQHLLDNDAKVTNFVDSNVTFLNSRLARYYGLDPVDGDSVRQVALKPEDHRGGLLTQGAVLKVTANGTNTSPVLRGLWVARRIMGETILPPPENVPAIEPDIRGAKTIRDQLELHRSDTACASCHTMIDPPGFALENFDAAGQWRENYLQLQDGRLRKGVKIDTSYVTSDGNRFENFPQFQKLVAANPSKLARSFAEKLLAYGTGSPISYADRIAVDQIVEESHRFDYGMRSILKAVVKSDTFQSK